MNSSEKSAPFESHQRMFASYWAAKADIRDVSRENFIAYLQWLSDQGHSACRLPSSQQEKTRDWEEFLSLTGLDEKDSKTEAFWGLSLLPEDLLSWPGTLFSRVEAGLPDSERASSESDSPGSPFCLVEESDSAYLFINKNLRREQAFASKILRLMKAPPPWGEIGADERIPAFASLHALQKEAVRKMLSRSLFVLSGGPGTGKTHTLGVFLSFILSARPELSVLLAAPTGRAASRLQESLRATLSASHRENSFPIPDSRTIHRLLGYGPDRPYPIHSERRPLAADLVILDEASMVDLELMNQLLNALAPGTALILAGDKDQLPSVETGAVLSSLMDERLSGVLEGNKIVLTENFRLGTSRRGTAEQAARLNELFRKTVGFKTLPDSQGLDRYRYDESRDEEEKVEALAREFMDSGSDRSGPFRFIELPELPEFGDRTRKAGVSALFEARAKLLESCVRTVRAAFAGPINLEMGSDELLRVLGAFIVLCPSRRGILGADALNRQIRIGLFKDENRLATGLPFLVTRNDYDNELFNGDRGLYCETRVSGQKRAYLLFPGEAGTRVRALPFEVLREFCEVSYAMTIHKSQGSEFDKVMIVLSDEGRNLCSREILYTALTRARQGIALVSSKGRLLDALRKKTKRQSLLAPLIRRFLDPS